MSVLEIVLYSVIGGFTAIYVIVSIIKIKKGKKNPKTEEEENEEWTLM